MSQDTKTNTEVVQEILRSIESLRFGSIEITVHDGRVTQIERREKVRFSQENQKTKPTLSSVTNH